MKTTTHRCSPPRAATFATVALAAALLALAPGRAAADPAAIFVGNFNASSSTVPAYSVTGAVATGYTVPAGFSDPAGVAYNPANNTLYVTNNMTNQIRTFNATTGVETTAATGFAAATGLSSPLGLTLNAGVLYAANTSGTVTAYNAANGARITAGFTSPSGLDQPSALAVAGNTLYVLNHGNGTLGAYYLATGAAVAGFTPLTGLGNSFGLTLSGTALFVTHGAAVGEYDATSGAAINANFLTGLDGPDGLAVLGNQLLVALDASNGNGTIGAYGIPAMVTNGNLPTSANANFITGLNAPESIAIGNVPEPSTWALLVFGAAALAVAAARRVRRRA